jgi:hypothetical protein
LAIRQKMAQDDMPARSHRPTLPLAERRPDIARRFLALTAPDGDCLRWTGYVQGGTTPRFSLRGKNCPARMVALLLAGRTVRHSWDHRTTCGRRDCVALAHVLPVRPARRRVKRAHANLTPAERAAICAARHAGRTIAAVAAEFHVSESTVARLAGPRATYREAS